MQSRARSSINLPHLDEVSMKYLRYLEPADENGRAAQLTINHSKVTASNGYHGYLMHMKVYWNQ